MSTFSKKTIPHFVIKVCSNNSNAKCCATFHSGAIGLDDDYNFRYGFERTSSFRSSYDKKEFNTAKEFAIEINKYISKGYVTEVHAEGDFKFSVINEHRQFIGMTGAELRVALVERDADIKAKGLKIANEQINRLTILL